MKSNSSCAHNRHEICTRLGLAFSVISKEFDSREDATEWIISNQFGRRNLSDYQRGVLALRMKPIYEARAKAQQVRKSDESVRPNSDEQTPDIFSDEVEYAPPSKLEKVFAQKHFPPAIRTDAAVASLANLGKDTIRKIEQIDATAAPEVKALAAAGEVSINLAAQFVALPVEAQQEAMAAIAENTEAAKEVMREAVKKAHVLTLSRILPKVPLTPAPK